MSWNEERYNEFVNSMETRFPAMFSEPYGGFAIGEGWWPIIEELCERIQSHYEWKLKNTKGGIPQVVVKQIKEKFGGLRFYYDGGDEYIRGLVDMTEGMCYRICEVCGERGEVRRGGWIVTLCDKHEQERQARMEKN